MSTPYDEVAYPAAAFRQTQPDRLASHAALFGLPFAPPDRCRVLDVGGGEGLNVIAMAVNHPGASYASLDLAESPVRRGQAMVEALALPNVRLMAADILDPGLGEERFDYIMAHGVYAWVPSAVRDGLMGLIRRHLAPHGVAFVSYNALPGAGVRQVVRDMLMFHLRGVIDPVERFAQAQTKLRSLIEKLSDGDAFAGAVSHQCATLLEKPASVLLHDELGEVYHPVHLHQFAAHADAHDLQFLTEAEAVRCGEGFRPPYALDQTDFDILAHAQELDFQVLRPFRQTLLIDREVTIDRRPDPTRLLGLWVSTAAARADDGDFAVGGLGFKLTDDVLARAIEQLGAAWPIASPVAELGLDDQRLGALLRMYWNGLVELHVGSRPFAACVNDRPRASPLARLQIARGENRITTLNLTTVEITDAASRCFIESLDGGRTHAEVARFVAQATGRPVEAVAGELPGNLAALARMPLLMDDAR